MDTSPKLHHPARAAAATLLLLLLLLPATFSQLNETSTYPPTITYSFASFNYTYNGGNFTISPDAGINFGALQITPDSQNSLPVFHVNKSGRILLKHPFKLWDLQPAPNSTTKLHVASFTTSFKMNIDHDPGTQAGEGLVFLIAPNTDDPPPGSYGGYLGLTNSTIDGDPNNHFVAVEFDTVKETNDPSDNHVGLNINSVISNTTTNLAPFGIELAPVPSVFYTVWIDYDGATRYITVYMNTSDQPKPVIPILNASLDLSEHLLQRSYFGFAASTGINTELNCILAWNLTVEYLPLGGRGWPAWKYAVAVTLPLVIAGIIVGILVSCYMKRRKTGDSPSVLETLKSLPGTPREFTFKELKRATNNFDDKFKLGQGGFGVVYKGVIPGENLEVAVKKFSREQIRSQDDFIKELTIINRLRHKHLVRLLGWCHKNGMLLLVYEFMPNGSLDQHLFGGLNRPLLTWPRRYNIITGLALALHYLHDEFDQKVVHRDLKASNVMLDVAFNARLGDFGLARAIEPDKTSFAELELGGMPGTPGYLAPECMLTLKATRQSDVFSFGAVMLEVACGRRPQCEVDGFHYLSDWVWKLYREGRVFEAVDVRLAGEYVAEEVERALLLALACSHPNPGDRPKTQDIVQILLWSMAVPKIPPFKPAFVWPSRPVGDEEDEETGTPATCGLTGTVVTTSYYMSTDGWSPQCLSREEAVGAVG